jgi:two-component system, OmpR family, phosphate regulon response regulator PhoB
MESTILVIEESVDLRRLFEYILRADGHMVAAFNDWQAAQAGLTIVAPDLVIFDWALTNTTGYAWAEALRRNPQTSDIPILFVCGDPPSHDTLDMLGELGISIIEKPFDIFIFRNRLHALLGMQERVFGSH